MREKVNVFLSHLKTRYVYDFPLYFSYEFSMSFLGNVSKPVGSALCDAKHELTDECSRYDKACYTSYTSRKRKEMATKNFFYHRSVRLGRRKSVLLRIIRLRPNFICDIAYFLCRTAWRRGNFLAVLDSHD